MMTKEMYINDIINRLSWLATQIKLRNSLKLYDADIHAESFFCGLLNVILGYHLENLNQTAPNYTAIDLGDKTNKIAIQVTVERRREKVQTTIDKFIGKNYHKVYERLIVLIIGDKPDFRKEFSTQKSFLFSKDRDVWDTAYLIREIGKKKVNELSAIIQYLDNELAPIEGYCGAGRLHIAKEMREKAHAECLKKLLASGIAKDTAEAIIEADINSMKYKYILDEASNGKGYLTGEFGTGKSHALTILAQRLSNVYQLNQSGKVPLFAQAKEVAGSESIRKWFDQFKIKPEESIILIDGLDEIDYNTARELIEETNLLLNEGYHIVVGSRSLFALGNGNGIIEIAPLSYDERLELFSAITGDIIPDMVFQHLEPQMDQMLLRPFFCIIFAQMKLHPQSWAKQDADIVAEFIKRSIQKCGDEGQTAYNDLAMMAAKSIDRFLGDILLSEVRLNGAISTVLKTGFITLSDDCISFPLPIIAQWFAAEAIRRRIITIDEILSSENRANRWIYALSILFGQMTFDESLDFFAKIVRDMPCIAPRIIRDGIRFGEKVQLPHALDCGEMIQQCMRVWIEALGPLSQFIAPCVAREVRPLALCIQNGMLSYSWMKREDGPSVIQLDHDEMLRVCGSVHSRSIRPQPTWPWVLTFEVLSDNLKKAIENHTILLSNSQLHKEWLWSLALHLSQHGSLREDTIDLECLEQYREYKNQIPCIDGKWIPIDDFFSEVDKLKEQGITRLEPPYPIADKERTRQGWIWRDYSANRYLQKARFTCGTALDEYMNLANSIFPALKDSLYLAKLYPCRFVGGLEFNEGAKTGDWGKDSPQMTWYWEAVPSLEEAGVDIELKKIPFNDNTLLETLHMHNKKTRPELGEKAGGRIAYSVFTDIISATPVTDMVYKWLKDELKASGWID